MAQSFPIVDVSFVSFWKALFPLSVKEMRLLNTIYLYFQGVSKLLERIEKGFTSSSGAFSGFSSC